LGGGLQHSSLQPCLAAGHNAGVVHPTEAWPIKHQERCRDLWGWEGLRLPLLLSLSLLLLLLLSAVGWRCQAPHPPLLHELAQPC
jgi:hypothetical protein